jgi:hypothetical protein
VSVRSKMSGHMLDDTQILATLSRGNTLIIYGKATADEINPVLGVPEEFGIKLGEVVRVILESSKLTTTSPDGDTSTQEVWTMAVRSRIVAQTKDDTLPTSNVLGLSQMGAGLLLTVLDGDNVVLRVSTDDLATISRLSGPVAPST